jgi:uncharacterized protein (TIGR03067 family)
LHRVDSRLSWAVGPSPSHRRWTRKRLLPFLALGLLLGADGKDAARKDQDQLQGDWALASGERDGQPFPEDAVKALGRTCAGDRVSVRHGDQIISQGPFTLDPSAKPRAIDIELEGIAQPVRGIYELEGDTFKVCHAAPREARPQAFATEAGSGHSLAVWNRLKK